MTSDSHGGSTGRYEKLGGATSLATIGNKGNLANGSASSSSSVGRAASWAVSFDKLLLDGAGVATFTVSRANLRHSGKLNIFSMTECSSSELCASYNVYLLEGKFGECGVSSFERVCRLLLQEFLKKEFSEENMVFWVKCETYKNISDHKEVRAKYSYTLLDFVRLLRALDDNYVRESPLIALGKHF